MHDLRKVLQSAALLGTISCLAGTAGAQQAEDSSQQFAEDRESIGAVLGLSEPESTLTTHSNGMTSAVMGTSHLKALVVRQNPDGSLSYGHAGSASELEAMMDGNISDGREVK